MKTRLLSVVTTTLVALLAMASPPGAAFAQDQGELLATGHNAPHGQILDTDGNLWVADAGMGGEDGLMAGEGDEEILLTVGELPRIVRIAPDGSQTVVSNLPRMTACGACSKPPFRV